MAVAVEPYLWVYYTVDTSEELVSTTTALHPIVSALEESSRKLLLC